MVSDQVRRWRPDAASANLAESPREMPGDGEHRRSCSFQPRYERLGDQTLQNRLHAGAGKTRDGAYVART